MKKLSQEASKVKNKIFQEFKNNNQEYLMRVKNMDVQNAAKDESSCFYRFLSELFIAEIT